jgi:hypothetical protein
MDVWELAEHFHRIFVGNQRAHGEFKITDISGIKAKGQARTVASPPSQDLWEGHLSGKTGIGVVPITESSTCSWGAIDIDDYEGLDLEDWSHKLPSPLVLCRSKSGGAHVYLFTQVPVNAALLRKKLTMIARSLGQPTAEVFPKQDTLDDTSIGNWINMPYYSIENTMRCCIKGGVSLTPDEFLVLVGESAVTQQELVSLSIPSIFEIDDAGEFNDAPPCLQQLTRTGFPSGSRNAALFSMGVYARKKFSVGWEERVFEYNTRFMGPGTYTEVAGVIRSLNKKSYVYKCKDHPLLAVCNKEQCSACTYGVIPNITEEKGRRPNILEEVELPVKCYAPVGLSKDDPYWVFTIGGVDIDVTVDMVRSQNVFAREYLRQYHRVILPIKDSKWVSAINELLADAELHELAPDAGPEGQFWVHLEDFCTNKAKAKVKDELLLGKPWDNDARTYFRSSDLIKYLDQQRFRALKEKDIWSILKRSGGKHHSFNLKGKHVACWSVNSFTEQTEAFDKEPLADERGF